MQNAAIQAILRSRGLDACGRGGPLRQASARSPGRHLGWLWVHNALALGLWPGYGKYRDLERMLRDRALLREGFLVTRELLGL
jgi:hypothetical protein